MASKGQLDSNGTNLPKDMAQEDKSQNAPRLDTMAPDSLPGLGKERGQDLGHVEAGFSSPPPLDYTPDEERGVLWKQDRTIMPLSAGIYFLCYLDRSNIGNARIMNAAAHEDMQTETHTTAHQFNIALMVFLMGYALFEVPSNILLKKLRPSRWLAFLMFSWGAITMGMASTHSYGGIAGVRFLLGAFEAGLFPGLVYYLTFWYRSDERCLRVAMILASSTLAGAFGGAIAYGVGHMNGAAGLSGWKWLFLIEGAPSCLSAGAVWFFLPDYPDEFLTGREKEVALARLRVEGSKSHHKAMSWEAAKGTLTDWRLYGHYAMYFGISVPFSSLSLFTPSITLGLGYKDLKAQLMTVPPFAAAYVVQIFMSYSADRFDARGLHTAALALIGGFGFTASALLPADEYLSRYACLMVAAAGSFSCIPPLLGWLTSNVWENTAAVGLAVALNVGIGGGAGQIPGVWIYQAQEAESGYPTGHWTNAAMLFYVALCASMMRIYYGWRNRNLVRENGGREVRLFKL